MDKVFRGAQQRHIELQLQMIKEVKSKIERLKNSVEQLKSWADNHSDVKVFKQRIEKLENHNACPEELRKVLQSDNPITNALTIIRLKEELAKYKEENKAAATWKNKLQEENRKLRELLDEKRILTILSDPKNWCPSKAEQWKRVTEAIRKEIDEENRKENKGETK